MASTSYRHLEGTLPQSAEMSRDRDSHELEGTNTVFKKAYLPFAMTVKVSGSGRELLSLQCQAHSKT